MTIRPSLPILPVAAAILLSLGCSSPATVSRQSSLMDYLSSGEPKADPAGEAAVQLPLAVGIAFLPGGSTYGTGSAFPKSSRGASYITPEQEQNLANELQASFASKPWVRSLQVIPSLYLSERGGFRDVEKVAALNNVEVMVLVSLNQVQFTDPKWYSWTYWTGLGAYTFKGDKNDTSTYVDAAVFHVPSRSMLFRAAGTSTVKGSATWAQRDEKLRVKSIESLHLAMAALCQHLDEAAASFREDALQGKRKDVRLLDRDGVPIGAPGYDPAKS